MIRRPLIRRPLIRLPLMRSVARRLPLLLAIAANLLLLYGWWETKGRASAQYLTTTVIVPVAEAALTEWQQGIAWNFRQTSGFTTDNTGQLYGLGYADAYPKTRTPAGFSNSVTFGRCSGLIGQTNLDSGIDPRFAGRIWRANGASQICGWQVDLPAAGSYEIRIAAGSTGAATAYTEFQVRDTDNTTVLFSCTDADGHAQDVYLDATCVERAESDWPSLNAAETVTISAGSPPRVHLYLGSASGTGTSSVAHLFIKQL